MIKPDHGNTTIIGGPDKVGKSVKKVIKNLFAPSSKEQKNDEQNKTNS